MAKTFAVLIPAFLLISSAFPWPQAGSEVVQRDKVVRVVDGDTVDLASLGRCRLIGVDAPESVKPGEVPERFGKQAADFTRSQLLGQEIVLEFDRVRIDSYGRVLVYIFLNDRTLFNLKLVEEGFALAYTRSDFRYRFEFLRAEDQARTQAKGIWHGVATNQEPFHGNLRSHVYHAAGCEYYECANCRAVFNSRERAERQGFKPHWNCVRLR